MSNVVAPVRGTRPPAGFALAKHCALVAAIAYVAQVSAASPTTAPPLVLVAHCSNTACNPATGTITITTVDDGNGNDVGQWSSLAIGDDGMPIISYYDATAGDLKVARCGSVRCD